MKALIQELRAAVVEEKAGGSEKDVKAVAAKIHVPVGFKKSERDGYVGADGGFWPAEKGPSKHGQISQGSLTVHLENPEEKIEFDFNLSPVENPEYAWPTGSKVDVSGHLWYRDEKGARFGYSRRGIDDWYHGNEHTNFAKVIEDGIKQVADSRERRKTAIEVPGLPRKFTIQSKDLEKQKADLAAGKSVSFHPHGMGTGYTVSKRKGSRYDTKASREMETFYGVKGLWISTFDAD